MVSSTSVESTKKGFIRKAIARAKTTKLTARIIIPVLTAVFIFSSIFMPINLETMVFMPTDVPFERAVKRSCKGNISDNAVSAFSLYLATKKLSAIL